MSKKLSKMYKIEPLKDLPPVAKLIWTYVAENGEGEYAIDELAKETATSLSSARDNIAQLRKNKLLIVTVPGAGQISNRLRAEMPDGSTLLL